ncbi:Uncharacterized protein PBTT_00096 [Plasmodiophora brassicae]|uniref:Uncharacterized protein n=1 Tax=Plasmodiophora brassicae TaxID=37360 RepID=A0A0G4J4G3_PLABS|nr:hypothetical protein PBRA_002396 [Plasmodiophora brassicae]
MASVQVCVNDHIVRSASDGNIQALAYRRATTVSNQPPPPNWAREKATSAPAVVEPVRHRRVQELRVEIPAYGPPSILKPQSPSRSRAGSPSSRRVSFSDERGFSLTSYSPGPGRQPSPEQRPPVTSPGGGRQDTWKRSHRPSTPRYVPITPPRDVNLCCTIL